MVSSLFCCLREGACAARQAYPAHRCCGGSDSLDTGKGRGQGRFAGHGAVIAPGAVPRYFRLWNGQESCRDGVALFVFLLLRQPRGCVLRAGATSLCYNPLPSTPGGMFPLSCIPWCPAGDLWKNVRKQKGPPARSRWPLISRREAAAYSPATAFWCSAMTLSATGWGASS